MPNIACVAGIGVVCGLAGVWAAGQTSPVTVTNNANGTVSIDAEPVPLNPQDPSQTAIGDFTYAGGVVLTSRQTNLLHELSDLVVQDGDRLTAVGDEGVFLEARLVLDVQERLVGLKDARFTHLIGEDGKLLLADKGDADAEGLTVLANGDRLVSFERNHRILLYPAGNGLPRRVPAPVATFPSNAGMEALAMDPTTGWDAYVVGAEASGDTWTCRLTDGCAKGFTIAKPEEFGLVGVSELPEGRTAYLLRAYDPVRRNRVMLRIYQGKTSIAQMDMAPPITVDNFEGVAAVPRPDGRIRFYLVSDDNNGASQRTLLMAFDWRPRPQG